MHRKLCCVCDSARIEFPFLASLADELGQDPATPAREAVESRFQTQGGRKRGLRVAGCGRSEAPDQTV